MSDHRDSDFTYYIVNKDDQLYFTDSSNLSLNYT